MTDWWDQTLEERVEEYRKDLEKPPGNCWKCDVIPGKLHQVGCDISRCLFCGGQAISCWCGYDEKTDTEVELDWDTSTLPWDGYWPNTRECVEYGLDMNGVNQLQWDQNQARFVQD